MLRSLSKMFSKFIIYSSVKASHQPEILLREFMMQRLNQSPLRISLLNVFRIWGWMDRLDFMKFFILLLMYSMRVQMSLQRQSRRQNKDLPVLLKASSKIKQDQAYFYQALILLGNYQILVTDLLVKIRLRLNQSIDVIYFLRQVRTAFTILLCSKSYFQPMRYYEFLLSILFMRSISYTDLPWSDGITSLRTFSSLKYQFMCLYFLPWSKKGYSPLNAIRQTIIPKENTSILELPSFC